MPERPRRTAEKVAWETPSITDERLQHLMTLFPEAATEGKIDFDKLKAVLGDATDDRPERYTFSWAGKHDAIRLLQTPSRATLKPCPEESIDWDTTRNVFIEGENLEVLKLLYKSYFGRVKLIYIDPPYNTGNDFIYPDNFADPLDTYLKLTGQKSAEGNLLTTNPESSGRYHSAWLSMMYPRLFLARQLLREDGVIFVSIDDHEVHNLRMLMNEVFGEENFYATIAWQRRDTPAADAKDFSVTHEYILAYVRSQAFRRGLLPRTQDQEAVYKNPDNDARGPWTRGAMTRPAKVRRNLGKSDRDFYPIKNPKGRECWPPSGTSWRVSPDTYAELEADNRIWWGQDADGDMPFTKRFLSEVQAGVVPITWWDYEFAGSNRNATIELRALFPEGLPFEAPKPAKLLQRIVSIATEQCDLVMDFFAGSCTTADAVLQVNHESGGSRRFIMVQLPEATAGTDFRTIADIGKERIRRAAKRIGTEASGKLELGPSEDNGFRVLKLEASTCRPWVAPDEGVDMQAQEYADRMALFTDPLVPGWKAEDVTWEVAVKEGYGLASRIEVDRRVNGVTVYRVADADKGQSFRICLDDKLTLGVVKKLDLSKDELFVCRDVALDDEAAANLALQCRLKTI